MAFFREGRFEEARRLYERVVLGDPQQFDALCSLAMACAQLGRVEEAVTWLRRAIDVKPHVAPVHCTLAAMLNDLQRADEALASSERAIALDAALPEAHYNRGLALGALTRLEAAVTSFDAAIALRPSYVKAHCNRGLTLYALARFDEALVSFDVATELAPLLAEAHQFRGVTLCEIGRAHEGLASLDRAIALKPDDARISYDRALALMQLQRPGEALASLDHAIGLRPGDPQAHNNRGLALRALNRQEEAIASFDRALARQPDYVEAFCNRGIVLSELMRYQEALASYETAIALNRNSAEAYSNRGVTLHELRRLEDAISNFDEALRLDPNYADAHLSRSLALLAIGRVKEGFEEYRWRWRTRSFRQDSPNLAIPAWEGESLAGKAILVHSEQGFGDSLQFIRYARVLSAMAARVSVCAPKPLVSLFRDIPYVDEVRSDYQGSDFDYVAPMMCLPRLLDTTLETIPGEVPYLKADPAKVEGWAGRLSRYSDRIKLGLVWAGEPRRDAAGAHAIDRRRSMRLHQFAALADVGEVRFFSLQKGEPSRQASDPAEGMQLVDFTADLDDFSDTAALIENLDLVITVDTAVAHLAGALAKPVWILSRFDGCWRWLNGREDSPWYPTARIFHQRSPAAWDEVVGRVAVALREFVEERVATVGRRGA